MLKLTYTQRRTETHIGQLTFMCSELRLCFSPIHCITSIWNSYCIGLILKSQNGEARTWHECWEGEEKAEGETLTGWESKEPWWRDGNWRMDEEQGPIKRPGICDVDTEVCHWVKNWWTFSLLDMNEKASIGNGFAITNGGKWKHSMPKASSLHKSDVDISEALMSLNFTQVCQACGYIWPVSY